MASSRAIERRTMLVYDLILHVLELCHSRSDYKLLASCALVNWEFNRAASRVLYERVVVAPRFSAVLDLRDTEGVPKTSNFMSACLPQYAHYVLSLEVSGYVSERPPPRNTLPEALSDALRSFVNLYSVQFTPTTYHTDLFTPSLPLLLDLSGLTSLSVNASCSDEEHSEQLVQISNLRVLTLVSPGRAILYLLPDWLGRLSNTLTELHLQDNCGSVTPGVLKSFVPHVKDALKAFTLGLSYSLTDDDLFTFLGSLMQLRRVHVRYYWQMRHPPRQPSLHTLRSFTATYQQMGTAKEVADFNTWVRRAISGSPHLESIHLLQEDDWSHPAVYDGLIDHLVKKHSAYIRVLDISLGGVSVRRLKELLESCVLLEELSVTVDKSVLETFIATSAHLTHLHSASLQISNMPKHLTVDKLEESVKRMITQGPPALRRVRINDVCWEASWGTTNTAEAYELIAKRGEVLIPPWQKTANS